MFVSRSSSAHGSRAMSSFFNPCLFMTCSQVNALMLSTLAARRKAIRFSHGSSIQASMP